MHIGRLRRYLQSKGTGVWNDRGRLAHARLLAGVVPQIQVNERGAFAAASAAAVSFSYHGEEPGCLDTDFAKMDERELSN